MSINQNGQRNKDNDIGMASNSTHIDHKTYLTNSSGIAEIQEINQILNNRRKQ